MSDTDSEDGHRYQPVLAEKLQRSSSTNRPQSFRNWPKDGVSVYHNELFTDGDVLGGEAAPSQEGTSQQGTPRAVGPHKMQQQKSAFASRRQERMQANVYELNESLAGRSTGSPHVQSPSFRQHSMGDSAMGSARAQTGKDAHVFGLRSSYDPNEEELVSPRIVKHSPMPVKMDISDLPTFLMQPGPKNAPVLCYIVRDKGSAKMYPRYNLYLEDGRRFLLAARKRKKQTTSNYLISLDFEDMGRDSENFFGKLRSNFVGTEFTVFDSGKKPGSKAADSSGVRQEMACITYQYNVLGTRGPRKMTAAIPAVNSNGQRLFRPTSEEDTLLDRVKNNTQLDDLVVMRNKPPRWNEELNAYCLNFNGRVTEASVKNFQLVADENINHVILQFGKIGQNTFTMDYQWPINALQAFCICLSSFDNKLACE